MKKFISLICLTTFLVVLSTNAIQLSAKSHETSKDVVYVWSSPDLVKMATSWVDEYTRLNPEINLELKIAGKEDVAMLMDNADDLGFFSHDFLSDDLHRYAWKMVVGRDIIIPVMNTKNPFLNEILQKGITPEQFIEAYTNPESQSWGKLLDDEQFNSIDCVYYGEQYIDSYLAKFLKTNQEKINYTKVSGKDELTTKILSNPYSIGFCRLTDVLNAENKELIDGVSLIPIDINSNKKVDYFEDIYNNSIDLARGTWIGKYPKALYQNIFAASGIQPTGETKLDFLQWVLTGGQQYLFSEGYTELVFSERKSKIDGLAVAEFPLVDEPSTNQTGMLLVFIGLLVAGGFILFLIIGYYSGESEASGTEEQHTIPVFGDHSVTVPAGLFFDKSHTWAIMEKDGAVRIGIDDFLQHVTGSITKVKMKNTGDKIRKGDPFLSLIQNGKQLDIKSPVSGTILERNPDLHTRSSILNTSPYGEGWVYMMKSDNWLMEIKSLFMGEAYQVWLKYEFARLKDFFSFIVKSKSPFELQVVMQDGGIIKDHILEEFGPQVWEEFQNEFINGND